MFIKTGMAKQWSHDPKSCLRPKCSHTVQARPSCSINPINGKLTFIDYHSGAGGDKNQRNRKTSPMNATDRILQLIISVFLIVGVYQFYFWCQRNQLAPPRQFRMALDDLIPYRPRWVWIYSFLYYPV